MMDRSRRDRDNVSTGTGRTIHTYTPRSHEDLLKSHLQLDASRNAKLQNELRRLADENKRLQRDLDNAHRDIEEKKDEIDYLQRSLKAKPKPPTERSPTTDEPKVFEIDGKPLTLDQILNHFDGVIQKHHDLLDKKNQQIFDLEDALRNRPKQAVKNTRNAETQSLVPREDRKQEDFAKELALIRKEYEQVVRILTDRNNKLESLIEDLRKKLDQYADEIGHLRHELASRGMDPNESTMILLKEKEKENNYLKDLIDGLKHQPQTVMAPGTNNEYLENEIKKIIEDKKNAVKKLSNMIIELKKTPSGNIAESTDMTDVEKECKDMIGDLNNMNDKLNNVLLKIRQTPHTDKGETVNKDNILYSLSNLKKQCENEIEALKNQLKSPSEPPVMLKGLGHVRLDDPDLLKRQYPDNERIQGLPNEPIDIPSNIQFYLFPQQTTPVRQEYPRTRSSEPDKPVDPYRNQTPERYPSPERNPTPESSLKSFKPVEFRSVTPPETSYRTLPHRPKERLYPIPSETRSPSPRPRPHSAVSCEACQEDYVPSRRPQEDNVPIYKQRPKSAKPKKKGCCGGKGSETSNVPYERHPKEEEIVYIHQPERSHHEQPRRKKSDHSPSRKKSEHSPSKKKNEDSPTSKSKIPVDSSKSKKKLVSKLKPDKN